MMTMYDFVRTQHMAKEVVREVDPYEQKKYWEYNYFRFFGDVMGIHFLILTNS
jgi:hypothetical protein